MRVAIGAELRIAWAKVRRPCDVQPGHVAADDVRVAKEEVCNRYAPNFFPVFAKD